MVPADGTGRVDPDAVRRAITPRTFLVSVMHVGVEPRVGMGAVRLSLGRMTTAEEIDGVLARFAAVR